VHQGVEKAEQTKHARNLIRFALPQSLAPGVTNSVISTMLIAVLPSVSRRSAPIDGPDRKPGNGAQALIARIRRRASQKRYQAAAKINGL